MAIGRVFTVPQASKYLGVQPETIRVAARKGELKGIRDFLGAGGPWRFSQEELDTFRAGRQRRGSAPTAGEGG